MLLHVALLSIAFTARVHAESVSPTLLENWDAGFKMRLRLQLLGNVNGGWKMNLKFSKDVSNFQIWRAQIVREVSPDEYELENLSWNGEQTKCGFLEMDFMADKVVNGESAPTALVTFTRKSGSEPTDPNACGSPPSATTAAPPGSTSNPALTSAPGTSPPAGSGEVVAATFLSEWLEAFNMKLKLQIQSDVAGGWRLRIEFSVPVSRIEIWDASFVSRSDDGLVVLVENQSYNSNIGKCSYLEMPFNGHKVTQVTSNPTAKVTFIRKQPATGEPVTIGGNACITSTAAPTTEAPTTSQPSTSGPTTEVSTSGPTTEVSTSGPTTEVSTSGPTTEVSTSGPTTEVSTSGPTTEVSTSGPTTEVSTSEPETESPTTSNPTTHGATTTSRPAAGPYDYSELLRKSILFYEAERSGKLPTDNRIPYRGDSALGDRGDNGEDLTGGWYDAGDHVKFGFPMAYSTAVLAWGLVEYRDAYQASGELDNMLDCIKWPLDYFIKAHTAKFEFYGQVGDGHVDHAYWGRPEDMTMARPAWKITTAQPGSDLAAETAAAMAAGSIAFQQTDPNYAATLLQHAEELYEFADTYRGKYSDAIPNAQSFYNSWSGFNDELVWGAAWLYRATKKAEYLTKAEQYYQQFGMNSVPQEFSWDDKKAGAQLLLAKETGKPSYQNDVKAFLDRWLPGGGVTYTPKGLAWLRQWGPNRYAANTAFIALMAADLGLKPSVYREFAQKQIHYMLGDGGRSYVVGFGNNPPQRPHHRSSSCPNKPAACTWNDYNSFGTNPQVLYGALVGGPGYDDYYVDDRKDFIKNEVANDYNAGFQSAVAGLKHLESNP